MNVTITLGANGGFDLQVPSILENRQHTIHVPASPAGLGIIRKILSERAKESRRELGFAASPTQAQVELWLAQDRMNRKAEKALAEEKKEAERAAAAEKVLGGLNLGDLDL
jgi:hypothetical protein